MSTECKVEQLEMQGLGRREVVVDFAAGHVTSDAGALLLREFDRALDFTRRLAACFTDHRDPQLIEHTVGELLAQRIFALALGYEDLNDHERLRRDPLLATLAGKLDPTGQSRARERDRGCALAGKSTLNRLELTPADASPESRYQKIVYDAERIEGLFMDVFLEAHRRAPARIILDLDATDDPLHGEQEGRFFHGYYGGYCYLPLYIFCGDFLLCAKLRRANIDASAGALDELKPIVAQIRERWPGVSILLRADSGFAREEIMAWCKQESVDYVFGLAKNSRLLKELTLALDEARLEHERTGEPARRFAEFSYQTRKSWSRARRVVGKAEWLDKGANPRFVVTSLATAPKKLYEKIYCARGEMENRIKEQQLDLFADRTSAHTLRANQLRLWLASFAYMLMNELRRVGLAGTELARAQMGTIRLKLFKAGALVKLSVRRVLISISRAWPGRMLMATVLRNLRRAYPLRV
jgi:hypothetical protein